MRNPLGPLLTLVRSARGVAPESRFSAAKDLIKTRSGLLLHRVKRRAMSGQVRLVEMACGELSANRYFWRSIGRDPVWFDVQQRLERLDTENADEAVAHFVAESLAQAPDPTVIIGLARHPMSSDLVAEWLRTDATQIEFVNRVESDRVLGGAFAGAARILLEPDDATALIDRIANRYEVPDSRFFQVLDSASYRPAGTRALGSEGPGNRLVITESDADCDAVALLLPGSAQTSLIATSDTFGKADLEKYRDWPNVGSLRVEHVRSRITRFSQPYIDLHEATATLASQVCARLGEVSDLLESADQPFLEVEVADFLFFQALKIRALEQLVGDQTYDEVVVALSNQRPEDEFLALLRHVDGLLEDPRLEVASVSRTASQRTTFWGQLDGLFGPPTTTRRPVRRVPLAIATRSFRAEARRLTGSLPSFPNTDRPRALFVTTNNAAYNSSTAAYAQAVDESANVSILHMGQNAADLALHLDGLSASHIPIDFLTPVPERVGAMAGVVADSIRDRPFELRSGPAEQAALAALEIGAGRLAQTTIAPAIARMRAVRSWLRDLQRRNELPDIIVMSPNRSVSVTSVIPAARSLGVPTVVLEPHAQDANYSRYIKIAADRYGVLSEHFAINAAAGLGIMPDRISVVGSPRQVAPEGYDPVQAQRGARISYSAQHGVSFTPGEMNVVFFCQPSDWSHVSKVWANVLQGAGSERCRILLKTHPEESVNRAQQYLDQAASLGMSDLVVMLDCDAATAIALGDLVLTAYSAAAIDAAIRQRPVVCVTDGNVAYPVDIPAIVGAQMVHSAAELGALLADFRADPEPFTARSRAFIERERQFVDGPGSRVRELVQDVLAAGPAVIRPEDERPISMFLDGPHPVFSV